MDTNPHRKPYDETTRKYWRDWYNAMNPEEKKEFNHKRYLRSKELKATRLAAKRAKSKSQSESGLVASLLQVDAVDLVELVNSIESIDSEQIKPTDVE